MYDERLTAPRSTSVLVSTLAGLSIGLALFVFGLLPALIGLMAGAAAGAVAVSSYGSARLRVTQGSLIAGEARIPLSALGEAQVLDPEEASAWRLHKADPRAFMVLRSYIPTALRVEVTDPDDPTPYLYLSSRFPQRLADALRAGAADSGAPAPSGSASEG